MYLSRIQITNFRCFGEPGIELHLRRSLNALVGPNDGGKTAIVDAIRYVILPRDRNYIRVEADDFHVRIDGTQTTEIEVVCDFQGLTAAELGAFSEFLSHDDGVDSFLRLTWRAAQRVGVGGRISVTLRAGSSGGGPILDANARDLLTCAYLRPLRDAEKEMSPGRGSRLSQVLASLPGIEAGESFDRKNVPDTLSAIEKLSLVGISDFVRDRVQNHESIKSVQNTVNGEYLSSLLLADDKVTGRIGFVEHASDATRLRQVLERLKLGLADSESSLVRGRYGLGSNNLLFMACELLLLGGDAASADAESLPLLLVEEPEAHLHPQRQLRLVEYLVNSASEEASAGSEPAGANTSTAAVGDSGSNTEGGNSTEGAAHHGRRRPIQVLMTTHSPSLASQVPLESLTVIHSGSAFSLAPEQTSLSAGDYRFLERFLDSTKANLFFADGVILVEGVAEAILLPTLGSLLGYDLATHGVSIVNVGSTALFRYAKIMLRRDGSTFPIPVACIADLDVMPDCAPSILGLVENDEDSAWVNTRRRWKAVRDVTGPEAKPTLDDIRARLTRFDQGNLRTFVAPEWTFEYALAKSGLNELVYIAAMLDKRAGDDVMDGETRKQTVEDAKEAFAKLDRSSPESLSTHVYLPFFKKRCSKAGAAQQLASLLAEESLKPGWTRDKLRKRVPDYLVEALKHVCRSHDGTASP